MLGWSWNDYSVKIFCFKLQWPRADTPYQLAWIYLAFSVQRGSSHCGRESAFWVDESARMTVYLNYLATSQISWCDQGLGAKEQGEFNGAKMISNSGPIGSLFEGELIIQQYKEFRPRHIWFYRFIFYTSRCCPSIFCWPSTPLRWKSPDSESHAHVASWWWTLLESHGPGPLVKQTSFPWRW